MFRSLAALALLAAVSAFAAGGCSSKESPAPPPSSTPAPAASAKPVVVIETSLGTFKAELWPDKAPKTVANFLTYVDSKFYDGTIFHRVIPGFMAQGGGLTPDMKLKETLKPISNEAREDTQNLRGTLAMGQLPGDPDSATSQFYINLVNNSHLDKTATKPGYCVFGKVLDNGMEVVDKIAQVPTGPRNVPVQPIIIKSIRRAESPAPKP
ncbi:MAG: peptidylprolyl isomerase [Phycisphaerae bacterium]